MLSVFEACSEAFEPAFEPEPVPATNTQDRRFGSLRSAGNVRLFPAEIQAADRAKRSAIHDGDVGALLGFVRRQDDVAGGRNFEDVHVLSGDQIRTPNGKR